MYIPEFWCGVIACIGVEFAAMVIYSLYKNITRYKENDEEKN